ncbi:MAG: response regulator [Candidatus Omnitrophica bacterium]|nr:response regulator [Candidatus Omnitrophota bacterium]
MAYKILVVDDEKQSMDFYRKLLLREGYEVVEAYDGEEALQKVDSENPDIVILDLIMPKLSGFEVLQAIRVKNRDKWIPVIIVSGNTELKAVKKSYDMEADHYLTKPVDVQHILSGLQTMISLMPLRKKWDEE